MNEKQGKMLFGAYICTLIAGLQVVAWMCGLNGAIFAASSAIIAGISGAILGFTLKKAP
jgi:hypothetical protein